LPARDLILKKIDTTPRVYFFNGTSCTIAAAMHPMACHASQLPRARMHAYATRPCHPLRSVSDASMRRSSLACMRASIPRRRWGFFYTPFLSRFYGIQFYGFRARAAVQDSWFAVHARIACMTGGQSARLAWNTACDPRALLLGSPAAIPRTSPRPPRRIRRGSCTVPRSFIW
jgi:hypothetical protein